MTTREREKRLQEAALLNEVRAKKAMAEADAMAERNGVLVEENKKLRERIREMESSE